MFGIDVFAYAVMGNHCQLVLSVDQSRALSWDDREGALRWKKFLGGIPLVPSFAAGKAGRLQQPVGQQLTRTRVFDNP